MQRRARLPDRPRHRTRRDELERRTVARRRRRLPQRRPRDSRRYPPGAEPRTGHRRRVVVEVRAHAAAVGRALREAVAAWQAELPWIGVVPTGSSTYEMTVPPDGGHE